LPTQNLSKPRNSMTFTRASATFPASSSWMVTLAWPSMRLTGWMTIVLDILLPPALRGP
jgi:hypothetical protein